MGYHYLFYYAYRRLFHEFVWRQTRTTTTDRSRCRLWIAHCLVTPDPPVFRSRSMLDPLHRRPSRQRRIQRMDVETSSGTTSLLTSVDQVDHKASSSEILLTQIIRLTLLKWNLKGWIDHFLFPKLTKMISFLSLNCCNKIKCLSQQ